jgi:long-chain acyl-CoA synthetase
LPTVEQMRVINSDGRYDVSSLFAKSDMSDWRMPLVMPASAPMSRAMGCYGQTEISGLAILAWLGGSGAGRPAPFVQVRIVDAAGNECAPDETGEIVVRGPLVMCGYYNRDEENARRVAQGWHHTHDLGLRRPDGSLVFVGPKTTMIKSGVENIYPAEVEACLRTHPAVLDVCVIGVPDPTWQQNVKAIVVPRPGHAPGADELIQHCRDRIASYKKPKLLTFVDALPRGAAGTIDREAVDAAHGGGGYPAVG